MSARELAEQHRQLLEDSAISEEVARECGYWTATRKAELETLGFSRVQRSVPALVIPIRDATGGSSRRLLTAEDLARRWQVPTGWIYAKRRTGELPKVPLPGKYIRFRLDTVEAFERGECTRTTQREEVA